MSQKQTASSREGCKQKSGPKSSVAEQRGENFKLSTPVARVRLPNGGQKLLKVDEDKPQKSSARSKRNSKQSKEAKSASKRSEGANAGDIMLEFARKAHELKADISGALELQAKRYEQSEVSPEPPELVQLRESIELLESKTNDGAQESSSAACPTTTTTTTNHLELVAPVADDETQQKVVAKQPQSPADEAEPSPKEAVPENPMQEAERISDSFEPLMSRLDAKSKFVALKSSLEKSFAGAPEMLEPVCKKLLQMSEANQLLAKESQHYRAESERLLSIKAKLEQLCRELQRSNSSMRIESLDLIRLEQAKAKEQAGKIQSTLCGVMKLFDENQRRNLGLKQENVELQNKLRTLLEHCDGWEKSVEASLRQRDIELRLVKTELAKANLVKNEEKEQLLGEKKELLKVLATMQEQQHKIETQEAKLRLDLASYASKYDQCQSAISNGLSKFQLESKRMLKQLEKSKQDYVALLAKYESSNKRIGQLLEERQRWELAGKIANKKVDTLERLCRALKSGEKCASCVPDCEPNNKQDNRNVDQQPQATPAEVAN